MEDFHFLFPKLHWERRVFSTNGAGTIWISISKMMNLDPHFTPYTKINSKWIVDLNVRAKIIELLEDNLGENLWNLEL